MLDFNNLEAKVASLTSVVDSVIAVLNSVAAEIRDKAANQAEVEDVANRIDQRAQALAAAVAANTPAEPTP